MQAKRTNKNEAQSNFIVAIMMKLPFIIQWENFLFILISRDLHKKVTCNSVSCWLLLTMILDCIGAFVGINIGTDVSSMPQGSDVVAILKAHQINHVRLYDADSHMLKALADSGIEVTVGVTNEEVLGIGEYASTAAAWINKNVAAYVPSTNITAIAVGSEVLTSIPHAAPVLVTAMNNLHKALVASNLNFLVKVSSPQSMDLIPKPFPPLLPPLIPHRTLQYTSCSSF